MPALAVTAIGADRPGIVAAVTAALVERGCNLEDTSMSILRGQFAMVLIVDAPDGVAASDLEADLVRATASLHLVVSVRPVEGSDGDAVGAADAWTVVVYGADHPGIVYGVSSMLAGLGVNIVDLTTRVTGGDGAPPIYSMVMEVTLPAGLAPAELQRRLEATAAELGVECNLHPDEADIL
ncbi:MAG: glycine cleavage system transcriptional repressor [Actinomycetota bacterium]|jgi:glycine cleavage system transcriptional repressor|nr:glycine cleavage system transcriptional repressor [Actinomycetota bacterium]